MKETHDRVRRRCLGWNQVYNWDEWIRVASVNCRIKPTREGERHGSGNLRVPTVHEPTRYGSSCESFGDGSIQKGLETNDRCRRRVQRVQRVQRVPKMSKKRRRG